ncbi:SLAM family member 5-like [Pelobates fuscus]|uniref:SLAM family member 5-like n=1 Tax=Pelobates fuscus TaxID=191477 RepID=UPI002FE42D25
MMCLYYWGLLLFSLQTGVLCTVLCGDKRTVIGAVGGDVILPVNLTGIKDISWVFVSGGNHFATTKPGGHIDIRYNRHKGRLYGTADGSLHFTKLTSEDQGEYRANILTDPGNKQCDQRYDLRVFRKLEDKDIEIDYIARNGTCVNTFLCKIDVSDVTITWNSQSSSKINVTDGLLYVSDTNASYTCTAQNPVSTISKTVNLEEYCNKEPEVTIYRPFHWTVANASRVALIVTGAICICFTVWIVTKKHEH